jgi:hypothetical protein
MNKPTIKQQLRTTTENLLKLDEIGTLTEQQTDLIQKSIINLELIKMELNNGNV